MSVPAFNSRHQSTSHHQGLILRSIMDLYNQGQPFDFDPCYNRGAMYYGCPKPILTMDINPDMPSMIHGDYRDMPQPDNYLHSICADPPFLIGRTGIMIEKYGGFSSLADLQSDYQQLLSESTRCIKRDGLLVIKCQDIIHDRRKYFASYFIQNEAIKLGWNQIDEYIKLNTHRMKAPGQDNQAASRSFHSKFLVFRFRRGRRSYVL